MDGRSLERQRWLELWTRLGGQENGGHLFTRLMAAYSEPGRAYHNAAHIRDCLAELDLNRGLAQYPDEVEAALWFHDAVYVPGATDNEVRSAELARRRLSEAAVPPEVTDRIAALVLATRHDAPTGVPDQQLICDIDLSILGREPEIFDQYERRIRREYSWVPKPLYRRERFSLLSEFLGRQSIYQTDRFRRNYEASARANLKRLLQHLAG